MGSKTENTNLNPSEGEADNSQELSPKLTKNITGLPIDSAGDIKVYGVSDGDFNTRQQNENNNLLRPNGLVLNGLLSNAKVASGINSFTSYNDYIHYTGTTLKTWNVYANLQYSAILWNFYNRNFR